MDDLNNSECIKDITPDAKEHDSEYTSKPQLGHSLSKYDKPMSSYVIVSRNRAATYYADRCRRVLRIKHTCTVIGRTNSIETACRVVGLLQEDKVAKVTKISTRVGIEPYFDSRGDACWSEPAAVMSVDLARGAHALCVMDYEQRRVIDIFEKNDPSMNGYLGRQQIEDLHLGTRFFADQEQVHAAAATLDSIEGDKVNLPDFIRYASALIHPLLKSGEFKQVLVNHFGFDKDTPGEIADQASQFA